jgi:aspartate 1-decarboxylase
MQRTMFKSKIHRATVTHADLEYEGSVTIDNNLLEAANILPHEQVHIWNITRGTRIETYTLQGPAGSGVICINGAAAHQNKPGDLVIICTFAAYDEAELETYEPQVVLVDEKNRIISPHYSETPGPLRAISS